MKRANRRFHYYRLKQIRKRRWEFEDIDLPEKTAGILATTACRCSCWMCGNPRNTYNTITKQEYLSCLNFIEGCLESGVHCSISLNQVKTE